MILLFFLLIPIVSGATIKGDIYDIALEKVNDVIVKIDSQPIQQIIAKNGSYLFQVPVGEYNIVAKYYEHNELVADANETVNVENDGEFVLDIILFPNLDEDESLYDEDIDLTGLIDEEKKFPYYILLFPLAIIIIIILIVLGYKYIFKHMSEKLSEHVDKDDYYTQIFSLIKKNKRMTQKEIRKEVPMSEAKISLVISQLESEGKVKKIKKGRGNIIVLK